MWPRLATVELLGRGRPAVALKHTGLLGAADAQVIATVAGWTDVVLVTSDDNMPSEHGGLISESRLTVAIVAPRVGRDFSVQAWERETVHRWAHLMVDQPSGSVVRYSPYSHAPWRTRRRVRTGRSRSAAADVK